MYSGANRCTFNGWSELKEELLCLLSLITTMPGTKLNLTLYRGYGKAAHQLLLGKQPSSGPNAAPEWQARSLGWRS